MADGCPTHILYYNGEEIRFEGFRTGEQVSITGLTRVEIKVAYLNALKILEYNGFLRWIGWR